MPEPSQPRTFGKYTVERELGRGGMGIVYAATHEVLGRRTAIKVLLNDVSRDSEAVDRFMNEARAASAIQHPSIVQVFEVERTDDVTYIAMELLQGESLASRLKSRGAMPIATAVGLARQCANALEAAHRAGIVHRDLKPDNVFLVPDAEVVGGERVKLLDFGVAKLVGDGASSVAHTVTGAILGTPHYMSPEQCEGAREVDPRSDLYSLGCMLFQMVGGRLPFQSAGIGGLIGMHLHVAPPLLRSVRPDAPRELEELVSRLLAKSSDDRVQTATEVAALLVEVPSVRISSPTVPPAPLPPVETGSATMMTIAPPSVGSVRPTAEPKRRARWVVPAIAAGAIGIAAIAIAASRSVNDEQPRPPAELPPPVIAILPPAQPPTTPAPTPPVAPPTIDPLTEGRRLLAQRDFEGAHTLALLVTDKDEAAKLENEIRQARENEAKAKVAKRPAPVVAKAPASPVQTATARPTDGKDEKAQRVEGLVKKLRGTTAGGLVVGLCWELSRLDNTVVPWDRCVAEQCKLNPMAVTGLIGFAPDPQLRENLRKLCPLPQHQGPQAPNVPRQKTD